MIYLIYGAVALAVVLLSKKVSEYVDLIEKRTSLSGAFVGGILLSAVTSLPEFFTSLSSTLFLNKPELCLGNILGSNLFNMSMLGLLVIVGIRSFSKAGISGSHRSATLCSVMVYLVIVLNLWGWYSVNVFSVSVTSILIIVLYGFSVRYLAADNGDVSKPQAGGGITMKQLVSRFIGMSVLLIAMSIWITYITDAISVRLNLGAGLAGAIFLGIATSLPEVSSSVSLFRIKSYDIAVGNIIGSNIFNFLILAIMDIVYSGGGLYTFNDMKTLNLLVFGGIAAVFLFLLLLFKNKWLRIACSAAMLSCYVLFLVR